MILTDSNAQFRFHGIAGNISPFSGAQILDGCCGRRGDPYSPSTPAHPRLLSGSNLEHPKRQFVPVLSISRRKNLRPAGIEPAYPPSQGGTLSIEIWAQWLLINPFLLSHFVLVVIARSSSKTSPNTPFVLPAKAGVQVLKLALKRGFRLSQLKYSIIG